MLDQTPSIIGDAKSVLCYFFRQQQGQRRSHGGVGLMFQSSLKGRDVLIFDLVLHEGVPVAEGALANQVTAFRTVPLGEPDRRPDKIDGADFEGLGTSVGLGRLQYVLGAAGTDTPMTASVLPFLPESAPKVCPYVFPLVSCAAMACSTSDASLFKWSAIGRSLRNAAHFLRHTFPEERIGMRKVSGIERSPEHNP